MVAKSVPRVWWCFTGRAVGGVWVSVAFEPSKTPRVPLSSAKRPAREARSDFGVMED